MDKKRSSRRLGFFLGALALINVIAIALKPSGKTLEDFGFFGIALVFAVVGSLILFKQPRHTIGWLLMLLPLSITVTLVLDVFLQESTFASPELNPIGFLYLWFNGWSWWLLIGPLLLILQLFPTGRVLSKRWTWVLYVLGLAFSVFMFVVTFSKVAESVEEGGPTWLNPIGFLDAPTVEALVGLMSFFLAISVIGSVAVLFVRYRSSAADERAQIRWLFLSGAFFMLIYVPQFIVTNESPIWDNLFMLGILSIPMSIGIAILRYRLWDIDVVINRSLVFAVLTTLLASVFAATAAIAAQIAKAAFGEDMQQAAAAVAAIVAASLFQPLRTSVESFFNRRLFPENIDLSTGLVELNSNLWSWVGLPKILIATLDHVENIYDCDRVAIYLKDNDTQFFPTASLGIDKSKLPAYQPNKAEGALLAHKNGVVHEDNAAFILTVPIYLPRRKGPEVIGVLRLGKRKKGRGYSGTDVRTLVGFGAKLAEPIYALVSARKTSK